MIAYFRHKFSNLQLDKNFAEIFTGSIWALSAQIAAMALGLMASVMIARVYGAEMVGILAIIQSLFLLATIVTVLGTNTSILRLIPEHIAKYSVGSAFLLYKRTQYLVIGVSIVVGAFLFVASDWIAEDVFGKPNLAFYFRVASCFVVFGSLMDLNTQAVRGLRLTRVFALLRVMPSAILLLVLSIFTWLSVGHNSPVYSQMIAWTCTAIIGVVLMYCHFLRRVKRDDVVDSLRITELLRISTPMMMSAVMMFLIGQTGVILLGIFRTEEEVGLYSIAVRLATLTAFILGAVNSMSAPKFSELFHEGKLAELLCVAKKSTKMIFWATMPLMLVLALFGEIILGRIFGGEFTQAYPTMLILIGGQMLNSMSGSTGNFMNMTGNEKSLRNIIMVTALISIVLSVPMIARFGITGAAIATAACMTVWNILVLLYIKRNYGQSIGYVPFLDDSAK